MYELNKQKFESQDELEDQIRYFIDVAIQDLADNIQEDWLEDLIIHGEADFPHPSKGEPK